jgi:hypothetical protein
LPHGCCIHLLLTFEVHFHNSSDLRGDGYWNQEVRDALEAHTDLNSYP